VDNTTELNGIESVNAVQFVSVALHGQYKQTNWQFSPIHFSSFREVYQETSSVQFSSILCPRCSCCLVPSAEVHHSIPCQPADFIHFPSDPHFKSW